MAVSLVSLLTLNTGCEEIKPTISRETPSLSEIDSLQKMNTTGERRVDEDSLWAGLEHVDIAGFGHYHNKINNYKAFRNYIPNLRRAGFSTLALELPTSDQSLLDSIMDEATPEKTTNRLLSALNNDLKKGDIFLMLDKSEHHPLFDIILDWLRSGGIVVAIDVPFIYDSSLGHNKYLTKLMLKTIQEQSPRLYEAVKYIDINSLDAKKDLAEISEVRSAYMSAMLNFYQQQKHRIVCFLGVKHLVANVRPVRSVSVSIPLLTRDYFNTSIFSFYPYFSDNLTIREGHRWLGNVAYPVPY